MEVVSRYHMSEQQEKDKKTYEAKERQAALKKSREMKIADVKVQPLYMVGHASYDLVFRLVS